MLIEIHMIQNHAPSNLNRDDTGSPKDAIFGGVPRARISSQCLKRSIRNSAIFQDEMSGFLGKRTRWLPKKLKEELLTLGCSEEDADRIAHKTSGFGSDKESDEAETRQLIFMHDSEIKQLAARLKDIFEDKGPREFGKAKAEELAKDARIAGFIPRSVDIALFGRMTTSAAFEDVQASMQVAHAISTTKNDSQFDYFTAVDDLVQGSEDLGAGMIGDVEFNSATYYKYFSLDWDDFVRNLGGDRETAHRALAAFMRAAALTTPTGKQNSFAAHNPPDAIMVEVKQQKVPTSYANAFVKPVRAKGDSDVVDASIQALSTYSARIKVTYDIRPAGSVYLTTCGQTIEDSTQVESLGALVKSLCQLVSQEEQA